VVAPSTVNTAPYTISSVFGVAVGGAGDIFISGIFIILPSGIPFIGVLDVPAGCSSCATPVGSGLSPPLGVAVDGAGDVFISDTGNNQVVEVQPGGAQMTLATGLNQPLGLAVDAAGNVFIADSNNNRVVEVPAGGGAQTTVGSGFSGPAGVAVDAAGDVFVVDSGNNRVEEVPAGGGAQSTVILQNYPLTSPFGVAVDGAGDVFISNDGGNQVVEAQRSQQQPFYYADTVVGSTSTDSPQSAIIQNFGNQTLTGLQGFEFGANFLQVAGSGTPPDCPSSFMLAPGESCNLSISFEPQSVGPLGDALQINSNALNFPSLTESIVVGGHGVPTPPTFSPIAGTYNSPQSVSITDSFSGTTIFYTTNGMPPSIISTVYTAPITVAQSETLEAIAVYTQGHERFISPVASASYTIQATVPNVVGDTQAAATTAITGASLVVGNVTTATSSTVAAGNVISESPVAGTVLATASAVNLVVSVGPTGTAADVSVTPSPATGLSNTFVLTYSDTGGYANLNHVGAIFGPGMLAADSCYVFYYPASNLLLLYNNAGTGTTRITPGSGTLSNSQCTIPGSSTSVVKSGDTLTLNLAVTASSTFTGKQSIFMFAEDITSTNTGWVKKGTWTPAANQVPTVVSVSPTPATGLTNTFTLTYSDPNGASDLDVVEVDFGSAVTTANSCFVFYYPATNLLALENNAGNGTTKIKPGSGTLSNGQCTISGSGTTVVRSGDTLTLNLAVTASSTYTGVKNIFMFAEDNSAAKTKYVNKGTWTP
jgi:Chitobiase/beta-hexosaminidase C-terminal domain/PASTA domain/NHL repeat